MITTQKFAEAKPEAAITEPLANQGYPYFITEDITNG